MTGANKGGGGGAKRNGKWRRWWLKWFLATIGRVSLATGSSGSSNRRISDVDRIACTCTLDCRSRRPLDTGLILLYEIIFPKGDVLVPVLPHKISLTNCSVPAVFYCLWCLLRFVLETTTTTTRNTTTTTAVATTASHDIRNDAHKQSRQI